MIHLNCICNVTQYSIIQRFGDLQTKILRKFSTKNNGFSMKNVIIFQQIHIENIIDHLWEKNEFFFKNEHSIKIEKHTKTPQRRVFELMPRLTEQRLKTTEET